jgi:hypothetical protein
MKDMNEFKVHECEFQSEGICIEYSDSYFGDGKSWKMTIMRLAAEDNVQENHYLDDVGDVIWRTVVTVNNCPFCGLKLSLAPNAEIEMMHIDSSGWSSKES